MTETRRHASVVKWELELLLAQRDDVVVHGGAPVVSRVHRQAGWNRFCVLPTQCIYVFCVDLRTNSDYFPIQH